MPNTYTQLHVQIVFAVKGRQNLIRSQHRSVLHQYITSVLQNDGHKLLAIFCMPDHLHFLIGLNPAIAISEMVLDVKRASTNFINEQNLIASHFNWQKGYGAFAYTKSHVPRVIEYILNQEQHHRKTTFKEEYISFLERYEIEYDEKYLFEFYE
jgi:REP element-mobilizing transposase RayT